MPITVKYHTNDGESFDTLEAAKAYEESQEAVGPLASVLYEELCEHGLWPDECRAVAKKLMAQFTITRKPEQSL